MELTEKGKKVLKMSSAEKTKHGQGLMFGMSNITEYVANGICYETAAYVRALLQNPPVFTLALLQQTVGQKWKEQFRFEDGELWDGEASIPAGTAVGFVFGGDVGHAAISVGGTRIRAVNGSKLGSSWMLAVDIARVITKKEGVLTYDNGPVGVYLSKS